jgi:4'-phosphopantetheinyl transferase
VRWVAHEAHAGTHPELACGDVHVWQASLDVTASQQLLLGGSASPAERERAARFRLPPDGERFLARRGLLRLLISRYVGSSPESVKLRYGVNGKPELAESPRRSALRFNVSHSDGLGLFAFARERDVGIDVEALRAVPEAERIAEDFFSTRERVALRVLPTAARLESFLRRWTCKEAYLKATGEGLARPLDTVEIEIAAEATWLRVPDSSRWTLREISPAAGYVGALVASAS